MNILTYIPLPVLILYYYYTGGDLCTTVSVPACSGSETDCKDVGSNNGPVQAFEKDNPDVYGKECKENGAECLLTDTQYSTCPTAKTSEFLYVQYGNVN